jgi:small subunit ribosomal protein S20
MANIKSKKKRILTNRKSEAANKSLKSRIKTEIKKANASKKEEDISFAVKYVDKGLTAGLFHKNKAARMKSKLDGLTSGKTKTTVAVVKKSAKKKKAAAKKNVSKKTPAKKSNKK